MSMKRKSLNEKQIRTILAVFGELANKPYDEINTYLGSITIKEMLELKEILNKWYHSNVLNEK